VSDDLHTLWLLVAHFSVISLLGIGGGIVGTLSEISRYVVDTMHWMTAEELAAAFALAQAAPGPNMLFVTLIGWHVAGWVGAVATTIAAIGPTTFLGLMVWRMREKAEIGPFGRAMQKGLGPLAGALMMSTGALLSQTVTTSWREPAVIAASLYIVIRYKPNPVWLIGAGGIAGMLGWL